MIKKDFLRTNLASVWVEDGILCSEMHTANIEMPKLLEHLRIIEDELGHLLPLPVLTLAYGEKVSKEVRDYISTQKLLPRHGRFAILVNSTAVKISTNFMLKMIKTEFPIKLFTDRIKAKEWLKEVYKQPQN